MKATFDKYKTKIKYFEEREYMSVEMVRWIEKVGKDDGKTYHF